MREPVFVVEEKIKDVLPEKYPVEFDGYSGGEWLYVGVFTTYPDQNPLEFRDHLLALSSMGGEDTQISNEH